jgi:hypothetical protein
LNKGKDARTLIEKDNRLILNKDKDARTLIDMGINVVVATILEICCDVFQFLNYQMAHLLVAYYEF